MPRVARVGSKATSAEEAPRSTPRVTVLLAAWMPWWRLSAVRHTATTLRRKLPAGSERLNEVVKVQVIGHLRKHVFASPSQRHAPLPSRLFPKPSIPGQRRPQGAIRVRPAHKWAIKACGSAPRQHFAVHKPHRRAEQSDVKERQRDQQHGSQNATPGLVREVIA